MQRQCDSGVYEFVFGAHVEERDKLLAFWALLGFEVDEEGSFTAAEAESFLGHRAALSSVRLRHPGCATFGTGFVRLQFWQSLANEGLGATRPIVIGSRWMGMYTHDVLQLHDSFASATVVKEWGLWTSPVVNAPLTHPAPEPTLEQPFIGLRELLVFGRRFRLAFIQRGGFDRPGFGTIADHLPFKNSEGSHASLVQPSRAFSTDFYKLAFEFETAPFGEPHDSGLESPTIAALSLTNNETFRIERTRAPNCPSGLLQVYASHQAKPDHRDESRPGCGNLCAYSIRVHDLDALAHTVEHAPGAAIRKAGVDEFGAPSLSFTAPDGLAWLAVSHVA